MTQCKYWATDTHKGTKSHKERVQGKLQTLGVKSGAPNCGIVSMAYILDKPVNEVHQMYKRRYVKGGNWKGRTSTSKRVQVLASNGVNVKRINFKSSRFCLRG